jgi:hypothetical protein
MHVTPSTWAVNMAKFSKSRDQSLEIACNMRVAVSELMLVRGPDSSIQRASDDTVFVSTSAASQQAVDETCSPETAR